MVNEGKVVTAVLKRFQKGMPVLRVQTARGLYVSPAEWMLARISEKADVFKGDLYLNDSKFYADRVTAPIDEAELTKDMLSSQKFILRKICRKRDGAVAYIRDEAFKYFKPTGREIFSLDGSDRHMRVRIWSPGSPDCFMLVMPVLKA